MRHKKKINHLSRTASHRKAMLSNMASSLILHKRINTTLAKAKALKVYVEPLITKSKNDTTHSRRLVFAQLQDKEAVTTLFREVSPKVADRPGGYTRIIKTGYRLGDNAEMCMIELVDFNELLLGASDDKKKTRRSRRGSSKKADAPVATAAAPAKEAEVKTEAPAEVEEVKEEAAPEAVVEETVVEEPAKEEVVEEAKEEAAPEAEAPAEEPKAEAAAAAETAEAATEEVPEANAEETPEEKSEDNNEEGEEEKKSE